VDATAIYWLQSHDYSGIGSDLVTCPITGCGGLPPKILDAGILTYAVWDSLALDSANVYVVGEGRLLKCPKSGGGVTTLVSGGAVPAESMLDQVIAVDGSNVYWTTAMSSVNFAAFTGGTLLKCAVGGCGGTPTVMASSSSIPFFGVALDASYVYWTEVGSTQGTVMRMRK
jgi:hypothetical protein